MGHFGHRTFGLRTGVLPLLIQAATGLRTLGLDFGTSDSVHALEACGRHPPKSRLDHRELVRSRLIPHEVDMVDLDRRAQRKALEMRAAPGRPATNSGARWLYVGCARRHQVLSGEDGCRACRVRGARGDRDRSQRPLRQQGPAPVLTEQGRRRPCGREGKETVTT